MSIRGTAEKPRIAVNRSNKYIYAQAIDDVSRKTLAHASSLISKKNTEEKEKKTVSSHKVGENLGKILLTKKITKAVYDRGQYAYNGRVKALAEGLRASGLHI